MIIDLEFLPEIKFGFLNGWIYSVIFIVLFGIFIKTCSKDVIERLYDLKGWTKKQKIFVKIAKLISLIKLILEVLTPLTDDGIAFILGNILFVFGLIGFLIALFNFKNSLPNKPITKGLYSISRNPQILMLGIMSFGMSFVIGSWICVLLSAVGLILTHYRILAEEQRLEQQYGESYLQYKNKIPRCLVFF